MTHHIITQVKESLGGVEKGLGVLRGVEKGLGVLRGIFGVLRRIEGHLVRGIEGHLVGGIEGYLVGGIGGHLVERRGKGGAWWRGGAGWKGMAAWIVRNIALKTRIKKMADC